MIRLRSLALFPVLALVLWPSLHSFRAGTDTHSDGPPSRHTTITIAGDEFFINGHPTYPGRLWHGLKVQGLLLNARLVQGIFDDRSEKTVHRWAYPDTGRWDPERNTREFIAAMPIWRNHRIPVRYCGSRIADFTSKNKEGRQPLSRIPKLAETSAIGMVQKA